MVMAEDELLPESLKGFSVSSSSFPMTVHPLPLILRRREYKKNINITPTPPPPQRKWQLERVAVVCAGTKKGEET